HKSRTFSCLTWRATEETMIRTEQVERPHDVVDLRLHTRTDHSQPHPEPQVVVIREGSVWQSSAFLCLCLLVLGAILMGQKTIQKMETERLETATTMASFERKVQQVEAGLSLEGRRRYLLLGMRNHILRVNPRVSPADAYQYAQLALDATERYPSVDPLLLLAIGSIESGYDPQARSQADARGLYQI